MSENSLGLQAEKLAEKSVGLERTAELLLLGKPVVIPTDTVYGLAIMVSTDADTEVLFTIKSRPPEKSIPWLIGSKDDLLIYTRDLPEWALALVDKYWPGALTLVCMASELVPPQFVAEDGSLALRMPDHELVLELLTLVGAPLATTSANISGQAAVNVAAELDLRVLSQVAGVLLGNDEAAGSLSKEPLSSTIVSCLGSEAVVLRQGAVVCD